jgi:hypothetical protein
MITFEQVQTSIEKNKPGWIAERNPFGNRFIKNPTNSFGLSPKGREPGGKWHSETDIRSSLFMGIYSDNPLSVDWGIASDGNDYLSKIRDQKNCGSCVAFAVCTTLEARMRIKKRNPNSGDSLSVA